MAWLPSGAAPIAPGYQVQSSATLACKIPDEYIGDETNDPEAPPVAVPGVSVAVPVRVTPSAVASVDPPLRVIGCVDPLVADVAALVA